MKELLPTIQHSVTSGQRCVLVAIVEIIGSSPRELGTSMLVTERTFHGSIGGGNLEYRAIEQARKLLSNSSSARWYEEFFGLGPAFNQCCGGAVKLAFEVLSPEHSGWVASAATAINKTDKCYVVTDLNRQLRYVYDTKNFRKQHVFVVGQNIFTKDGFPTTRIVSANECYLVQQLSNTRSPLILFGAGHVGKAVVQACALLSFRIDWVDQRADMFPSTPPENVEVHCINDLVSFAHNTSSAAFHLVMTHSHSLDYELCKTILGRDDATWLGLIGSVTKRRRFEQRLLNDGMSQSRLDSWVCPIGIPGISDKHPATIAASVAAQLLRERELQMAKPNNVRTVASA